MNIFVCFCSAFYFPAFILIHIMCHRNHGVIIPDRCGIIEHSSTYTNSHSHSHSIMYRLKSCQTIMKRPHHQLHVTRQCACVCVCSMGALVYDLFLYPCFHFTFTFLLLLFFAATHRSQSLNVLNLMINMHYRFLKKTKTKMTRIMKSYILNSES